MKKTLWLRSTNGETRPLEKRAANRLYRELLAGRGGQEVAALVAHGYAAFLGPDGESWALDELRAEHFT